LLEEPWGFGAKPFQYLLDKLQDPSGLTAEQAARVDMIAKEANRAGIAPPCR